MAEREHWRTKLVVTTTVALLSGVSMLWLFWHHPIVTAVVTLMIVAAFGVSARLAHWVEPESKAERLFPDTKTAKDLG